MLASGLTASLRGTLQLRAGAACLNQVAASRTFLSRPGTSPSLPTRRPLTIAGPLQARLGPALRRREALQFSRPQHPDSLATQEDEAALLSDLPPPPANAQQPSISRALFFLFGFSALSFGGAAYNSLRDTQLVASEIQGSRDVFANISSFFSGADDSRGQDVWGTGVTEKRLLVAKKHEVATRLGLRMDWLVGWCHQLHLPEGLTEFVGRSYLLIAERYLELSPSKQVVLPVVLANGAVFAIWTIASARRGGRLWRWMNHNFLHRPSTNRTRTMLTSVFSHQTFLHFLFNNLALWSIGGSALIMAAHQTASFRNGSDVPEATRAPHFLAFFATAGVFAATVSHIVAAIRFRRVSALHGLEVARAALGRQGSLGSSGAVYAALVMSACAFPEAQLGIIFLPFITVPIGVGVAGLVAADVAGILFRWRMFDHWAHLGGAAFGWVYWWYGAEAWEQLKKILVQRFRFGAKYAVDQR